MNSGQTSVPLVFRSFSSSRLGTRRNLSALIDADAELFEFLHLGPGGIGERVDVEIQEPVGSEALVPFDIRTRQFYVQDRMRQNGKEIWEWFDGGAVFAVCGDARRMAKDVDKALHEIVIEHGGKSEDEAKEYMKLMKKEGRYLRDVY